MAKLAHVTGINKIMTNLRQYNKVTETKFEQQLKKAGLFLQRESQKIVPVDTSNLKAGAETRKLSGHGFTTDIVILYKALYAIFVHEDLDAKHKEGKSAKFLEKPARENRKKILGIIRG